MRLLTTFTDPQKGQKFSKYLSSKEIANQIEIQPNTDWGSDDYGTTVCHIWIVEEDQFFNARTWLDRFKEDPGSEEFSQFNPILPFDISEPSSPIEPETTILPEEEELPSSRIEKMGTITTYLVVLCTLLFIMARLSSPTEEFTPKNLPLTPLFISQVNKVLLFDWPEAYSILDKVATLYGVDSLQNMETLPDEGHYLLKKFYQTPYWKGIYDKIILHIRHSNAPWEFNAPLFEKAREGEVWRLFTPCLLHADIFHIFFNMIWLIVLGRQMEARLGAWRYILFIIIAAILSNTAQYLMSGSNFIGFSGVVCAMIVFIWKRLKIAPWEGYLLHSSTVLFVSLFILAILGIQFASFTMEIIGYPSLSPGIANTAHITGGIIGYAAASLNLFTWRARS